MNSEWSSQLKVNPVPVLLSCGNSAIEYFTRRDLLSFSHNWTDMALQAFAVHPTRRHTKEAHAAADLLKTSFFQPDAYTSYHDVRYWVRFMFWWPNLVTALDSLSLMGYSKDDNEAQKGINWLIENQLPNGLWKLDYGKKAKQKEATSIEQYWLALKVAGLFKRLSEN
jgi:hypothetical protein